jgi:hypothetical protein
LRSGAPGGNVSAAITTSTATTARPAQRSPLASSAGSTGGPSSRASSPASARLRSHGPRRRSITRVVTSAITTVRNSVEPTPNHRLLTRSTSTPGSTSAAASLVMSVMTASAGTIRMFTLNAALTAPNPAAMPASGWRPTLRNAVAASGISTR